MTPTPPPLFNFLPGKEPVLTRGQYDYNLATDEELYEGYDDPMFPGHGPSAKSGGTKSGEGKAHA